MQIHYYFIICIWASLLTSLFCHHCCHCCSIVFIVIFMLLLSAQSFHFVIIVIFPFFLLSSLSSLSFIIVIVLSPWSLLFCHYHRHLCHHRPLIIIFTLSSLLSLSFCRHHYVVIVIVVLSSLSLSSFFNCHRYCHFVIVYMVIYDLRRRCLLPRLLSRLHLFRLLL